ncbi:hypothetical protein Tcan_10400 [Toxocara canis]|uniref:Uncharacterized protein n=1 Tax=Toxocara canis TaxID=6265 RepID=A0A0B2VM14_TOXCA|nr:hypothetical protein Tcan_10400 [Toxocara canis]
MTCFITSIGALLLIFICLAESTQSSNSQSSLNGRWTGSATSSWSSSAKGAFVGSSASGFGAHSKASASFRKQNEPQGNVDTEVTNSEESNKPKMIRFTGWIERD